MNNLRRSKWLIQQVQVSAAILSIATSQAGCASEGDHFGIYTSHLDGSNCHLVSGDKCRELNHARLSPDRRWITFTRYNHRGIDGLATEDNGYQESEIMLMQADGAGLRALIPAKKGVASANSQLTPDGKGIIFASNGQSINKVQGQICLYQLASGKTSVIEPKPPIAGCRNQADPHAVGDLIVFTAQVSQGPSALNQLWTMHLDGSGAKRLTNAVDCLKKLGGAEPPAGDFDPKLSPDGTKVAFMRHVTPVNFDAMIIDLSTVQEVDLSQGFRGPQAADAVPEWSSDGKLLMFWHVDRQSVHDCGIWTMLPDGRERRRINLPKGYFYTMPAFFPAGGSGPDCGIVFSGHRQPGL